MKLSRNVSALAVALVVNVLLVILLTPLGFESRPATDLKTVGYIAIGTIFTGLFLDLASIVLLFSRVDWLRVWRSSARSSSSFPFSETESGPSSQCLPLPQLTSSN